MKSQKYSMDHRGRFLQRLIRTAGQCVGGLLLLVGVFLLCPLSGAHAQTEVGGSITTNTDWTTANSPYLVASDIYVGAPENDGTTITLTIEAGVEVRFQPGTGLYIGQNTGGALIAIGGEAEADHILFTSHAADPGAGDWKGIRFGNYTDDATSVLQYVTVQYGGADQANITCYSASPMVTHSKILDSSKHGLYLRSSSSRIAHNTIQNNSFNGIWMQYANDAAIEQNIITENDDYGIYAYRSRDISIIGNDLITNNYMGIYVEGYYSNIGQYRNVMITDNTVENSNNSGIYVEYVSYVTLTNNTIANSGYGIYVDDVSNVMMTDNTITGNHNHGIYVGYEESVFDTTITNNTITANDGDGIYWNWSSGSIEDNTITDNGGNGITNRFSSTQISGNNLSNNDGYPISTSLENKQYIGDNSGSGNGTDAISIWRSEIITTDTTWTKSMWLHPSFPYVITGPIRIYSYAAPYPTLTIEPGLELQFKDNGGIQVGYSTSYSGALSAQGTLESPILFTSGADTPQSGDWQGISFAPTPEETVNILEHCVVEHAEKNIEVNTQGNVEIRNSTISNSNNHGIAVGQNASVVIEDSTILASAMNGIDLHDSASAQIAGNTMSNNDGYPISTVAGNVGSLGANSGSGNGTNAIEVRGGEVMSDSLWSKQPFPYMLTNYVYVRALDANGPTATLTLEPGVEVQFAQGRGIYIGESGRPGALHAEGTENNPIIFTSNLESPTPGSWTGIIFQDATDDANTVLKHDIVEYAETGINIQQASPVIEATIFRQNKTGIILNGENAAPTIVENAFSNNTEFGINKYKACEYNSASCPPAEIARNTFTDHGICGIRMDAANGDNLYDNSGAGTGSAVCIGWYNWGSWSGGGEISTDSLWKNNDPSFPYRVMTDTISVSNWDENAIPMLTIEPGVDVRFGDQYGNGSIEVGYYMCAEWVGCGSSYGRLHAKGTEILPITFTSNAEEPQPGDWQGIDFITQRDGSEASILEHCVIEYAGEEDYYWGHAISISEEASPIIKNNTIRDTEGHGIIFQEAAPTIQGNTIIHSSQDGIYGYLASCGWSGCYGLITNDSPVLISGNTISDNTGSAMNIGPNAVKLIGDNSGTGNGENFINIHGGNVLSNGIWSALDPSSLQYVVTGDITVRYYQSGVPVTLVLEPDVQLRFDEGTGLYINQGALSARGTVNDPIIFTSNKVAPGPGDWKGIYFRDATNNDDSFLEHTVIEYGGHTHNTNVYLEHAAPTIQYNTIRASSESGIRVQGTGSNGVMITCNNFSENLYGLHVTGNAQPEMHTNNFLGNSMYGLYNTGSITIDADLNWWGDVNGPNQTGDQVSGNVDYEPYLTAESSCILAPPTNSPPFAPDTPTPADEATKVALTDGSVTLSWVGGDPNPWDSVEYDVWFGTTADALTHVGTTNPDETQFVKDTLAGGTRYFWKIVARDDKGLETEGPIWQFITQGDPPDLIVSEITWEPAADIQNNQEVIFTTTIQNVGTGPVVDRFQVAFQVNDTYIGWQWVDQILFPGESAELTRNWTAQIGTHTITVFADSHYQTTIVESNEDNNTRSETLPPIQDTMPPEVVSTNPPDGAAVQTVSQIEIRLHDQHGTVDDEAVKSSITVIKDNAQPVNGTVSETNDLFTFSPENPPLADGLYQVDFTAADTSGNTQTHTFSFTVDGQSPAAPTITGGIVSPTGQIQPGKDNRSSNATITLTGTREDNTSVWIDDGTVDIRRVNPGNGDWSVNLSLAQGDNTLDIYLRDQADNSSPSVQVTIFVDSVTPTVVSIDPPDNSFLSAAPSTVAITIQEDGSGLKPEDNIYALKDSSMADVSGDWEESGGSQRIFTPTEPLGDSLYTLVLRLTDQIGNQSPILQYHFTVDTIAPPDPVVTHASPVQNPQQVISGTKEAHAAIILVDGQETEIVGHTPSTSWQYPVTLIEGENSFIFKARDRAGNESGDVPLAIIYNDTPPIPITIELTVNGVGDGTRALLDWSGYDESLHGDIASYRIYAETSDFTDVSGLTEKATVNAGTFSHTLENLMKGGTYWFAVVPVDVSAKIPETLSTVQQTLIDTVAPEDVTNVQVQCFADRLIFTWDPSANSAGDLAGYNVYFNGAATGEFLPAGTISSEKTGLALATAYPFRITAVDENNESNGVSITGITLLDNPTNLSVIDEQSGYVTITWNGIDPAQTQHLKYYAIYVSETDFSTVEGLTPRLTTAATTTGVAGLTNGVTYYITVTAVNNADGERQSPVTTVTASPVPDTQGPAITAVQMDAVPLNDGDTVSKPVKLSVEATDPSGVSRVEFAIDGTVLRKDYTGIPNYFCYWNVIPISDGSYILDITAHDTLGNSSTLSYTLNVALEPPQSPAITQPADGALTNQTTISVSGTAPLYSEVLLFNGGTQVGDAVSVDPQGNFAMPLTLTEGANQIQAQARYRGEGGPTGELSDPAVTVTLDSTLPPAPTQVTAQPKAGGAIKLTWRAPTNISVKGYKLYRATASFTTIAEAELINSSDLITGTSYTDLPAVDGQYFYRLLTVNYVENESELSDEVGALSDRTPPEATEITYTSSPPPVGGVGGGGPFPPGTVLVTVTVNEPLQTTPFLSITPENGFPISIELTLDNSPLEGGQGGVSSPAEYSGSFEITESTPTGTAYAVFSARDAAGNRGTEITTGGSLEIDTDGPAVTRLVVQPDDPIRNDQASPVTVTVTIGLDEAIKSGESPSLSYNLSGPGRVPVPVENLVEVDPSPLEGGQGGVAQAWQGSFTLPSDAGTPGTAGAPPAEYLSFTYQGVDDLENISAEMSVDNLFQIYQGDLPALAIPTGLSAESLPGGNINLTWNAVEHAAEYQLYRKAPGESDLSEYTRVPSPLEEGQGSVFLDEPTVDGTYTYAVASVRQENAQEALSDMSAAVEAEADSASPDPPAGVTVDHVVEGMHVTWPDPGYPEEVTYTLYRATMSDLSDKLPVQDAVPVKGGGLLDPDPASGLRYYALTVSDAIGNESAPSAPVSVNPGLLPVSTLTVRQEDTNLPELSWTHTAPGSIAGYKLYLNDSPTPIHAGLLTDPTYIDYGYAGDERRYAIEAEDNSGATSMKRNITLPILSWQLAVGSQQSTVKIRRGIMNRLEYEIENHSSERVEGMIVHARVESHDHVSETFSLDPGESQIVSVVIGGYADLPDVAQLTTTVKIIPNPGETVEIVRTSEIEVSDGMLVAQIFNEEFTRGITGDVRFALENTGEEEIEILIASGSGASPDIRYYLRDEDGNILTSVPFKQTILNHYLVTLPNGSTVARIPAGGRFESDPTTLDVPANAPDQVFVHLAIDHLYFHYSKPDQVTMNGLSTSQLVSLQDTTYYGEVLSVTPEHSDGDEDIVIAGRAVERATGEPMPGVPLNLVISTRGFDRSRIVVTDSNGAFSYPFIPVFGESGQYTVRAVHPETSDRAVQATFVITSVRVKPGKFEITIPKNYEQSLPIQVLTGAGTLLRNLHVAYEGDLPTGIQLFLPENTDVPPTSSITVPLILWADNRVAETATFDVDIIGDKCLDTELSDTGEEICLEWGSPQTWNTITIDAHFSEANPLLTWSPSYIETGLAREEFSDETVTLSNKGLAALEDVSVSLLADQDGTPAPAWVYLTSPAQIGDIPVGAEHQVTIALNPSDDVAEGLHEFALRVESANHPTRDVVLYVTVNQSGKGHVFFQVVDIYTGSLDENNEPIQGVSGARITVQNEQDLTITYTQSTSTNGDTMFEDLPAGRYRYRITGPNHQDKSGRFWVKPGLTTSEHVFLEYNLVTVEWEVKETTIEDRYEIVLKTIYETNAPAAVLVVEPASVTLPQMQPGDVFQGEMRLTNHGLIRADNITLELPEPDEYFRFEFLGAIPDSLVAQQSVTIPYRITCLQLYYGAGQDSGGGDCKPYTKCIRIGWEFECPNDLDDPIKRLEIRKCFQTQNCPDSPSGDGGNEEEIADQLLEDLIKELSEDDDADVLVYGDENDAESQYDPWIIGGSGGHSGGSTKPKSQETPLDIEEMLCYPKGPEEGPFDPKKWYAIPLDQSLTITQKDSQQGIWHYVGCEVNTFNGTFVEQETDLAVKVPGGMINIQRTYGELEYDSEKLQQPDAPQGPTWLIGTAGSGQFKMQGYPGTNKLGFIEIGDEGEEILTEIVTIEGTTFTLPPDKYRLRAQVDKNSGAIISSTLEYVGERIYYEHLEEVGENTYVGKGRTIVPEASANGENYRMEDLAGNWRLYDHDGFLIASGTPNGLIEEIIYADDKFVGIKDRNDNQVIWVEYNADGWVAAIHDHDPAAPPTPEEGDPGPRTVTYTYAADRLFTVTDVLGYELKYGYDGYGQINKKIDVAAGQTIDVEYYSKSRVKSVNDSRGANRLFVYNYDKWNGEYSAMIEYTSNKDDSRWVEEFLYDEEGHTKEIKLDGRIVKQIQRSQDGRTEVILDEKQNKTIKTYDEWDNLLEVVYPNDTKIIYEYDYRFHKVKRMVDQRGIEYTYKYNEKGNLTEKTEAAGTADERVTSYVYYSGGALFAVTIEGSGIEPATTSYNYDAEMKNAVLMEDPLLRTVEFLKYDAMGYVLEMKDIRGHTWKTEYDARGRQTKQIDPLGRTSVTKYDAANNVEELTAFGLTTSYGYDDWYNPETVTDALNYTTHTTYNGRGQPVIVKDQEGKQTHYEYDSRGRLKHTYDGGDNTIDGADNITTYFYDATMTMSPTSSDLPVQIKYPTYSHLIEYDKMGRVIREWDEDGESDRTTSVTYDAGGNVTTSTDAEGKTTEFKYDALNRLVWQKAPDGGVTEYKYDARDNLVWLKDPNGNKTDFEYDLLGRPIKVIRPENRTIQYSYAPRSEAQEWKETILPAGQRIKTYYDTVNRVEKIEYYANQTGSVPEKTVTFTYRPGKNLVDSVTDGQVTITYAYDGLDRPAGETVDYGNGLTLEYASSYYANGLPRIFTSLGGTTLEYLYDNNNRLTAVKISEQDQINFSHFDWNSPQRMQFPGGSATEYGYNNFRELTSMTAKLPGGHAVLSEEYTYYPSGNLNTRGIPSVGTYIYEYDDAYRLKTVTNPVASNESYTYDLLSNRKTAANTDGEWEYNARNELLGYADVEYRYDNNGNLTQVLLAGEVVWTYTYDVTNRLIHVEDGTGTIKADYGYDPFGRRLWKKVDGITTYFLYSDEGLIGEYEADGTPIRTYGYVGGEPLFLRKNGQYYWYRNDHLGTPRTLETGSGENVGKVVWTGVYDAFGNCQVTVDEVENNLRFPGQYFDAETGLYYNLNRYYDPKIGRYLQTDPAGDGLNPYVYVAANPVNAIDPDGLCAWRMYGGGVEMYVGASLFGAGPPGWIVGTLMILNGADNLVAGSRSLGGEYKQAFLESAIHHYVQNDLAANLLYMGTQIGIGYAGIRVHRAAIRTTQLAGTGGTTRLERFFGGRRVRSILPDRLTTWMREGASGGIRRNTLAWAYRNLPYFKTLRQHGTGDLIGWSLSFTRRFGSRPRIDYHPLWPGIRDEQHIIPFFRGRTVLHYHRRGGMGGIGRHRPFQKPRSAAWWELWKLF